MTQWPVVILPSADKEGTVPLRFVCTLEKADGPADVIALAGMMAPIGTLLWDTMIDGEIVSVDVLPDWQRKGVATRMLRVAEEISRERGWPPPAHSRARTEDGDAWARSLGAEPADRIQSPEDFRRGRET